MHGRLKPSATFHKLGFVAINPAVSRCFGDSFEIQPWNREREVGKSDKDDGRIPQAHGPVCNYMFRPDAGCRRKGCLFGRNHLAQSSISYLSIPETFVSSQTKTLDNRPRIC